MLPPTLKQAAALNIIKYKKRTRTCVLYGHRNYMYIKEKTKRRRREYIENKSSSVYIFIFC